MPYQADFTLCLDTKSKQKGQGFFLSSTCIFTKAKFVRVISSILRNLFYSLSFCFDFGFDKRRPSEHQLLFTSTLLVAFER